MFRLSGEGRLALFTRPNGKARMWPSRPSRVRTRGPLSSWRCCSPSPTVVSRALDCAVSHSCFSMALDCAISHCCFSMALDCAVSNCCFSMALGCAVPKP